MACSVHKTVDFTCYVPLGEELIPVRVPDDTQLRDLDRRVRGEAGEKRDEDWIIKTVILVLRNQNEQTEIEDSNNSVNIFLDGKTGTQQARTKLPGVCQPSIEIHQDNVRVRPRLSLEGFTLYSYMWLTFQWIEPQDGGTYVGQLPFLFYKIMRVAVALSLWAIVGFELYNLVNGWPALVADVGVFTAIVAVMHRLLWSLRYVILHHLGLYFFHAHQQHIKDVLTNSNGVSSMQWQRSHRLIQDLMAVTTFFLLLLPLLQKLIPIFIEQADNIPRTWDSNVETVEFFVLIYSRVMAMPVFFFLILVAEIHICELKNFDEQVQRCRSSTAKLFREYKALTVRIEHSSRAFQPYLVGLLALLVIWGTFSVYSSVEIFQRIPPPGDLVYGVVLSEFLGTFLVFLCETAFLFSLPLFKLGQVSSHLKHLIFTVTILDRDEQSQRGFAFNTEEKIEQFASIFRKAPEVWRCRIQGCWTSNNGTEICVACPSWSCNSLRGKLFTKRAFLGLELSLRYEDN